MGTKDFVRTIEAMVEKRGVVTTNEVMKNLKKSRPTAMKYMRRASEVKDKIVLEKGSPGKQSKLVKKEEEESDLNTNDEYVLLPKNKLEETNQVLKDLREAVEDLKQQRDPKTVEIEGTVEMTDVEGE